MTTSTDRRCRLHPVQLGPPYRFDVIDRDGVHRATIVTTDDGIEVIPHGGGFVSSAAPFADGQILRVTFIAAPPRPAHAVACARVGRR